MGSYAHAYDTSTQTIATAATFQAVLFATQPNLQGWTYSAGSFTAPKTGIYSVQFQALVWRSAGNGASNVTTRFTVNGAEVPGSRILADSLPTTTGYPLRVSRTSLVAMSLGDVLQVQITSGTSIPIDTAPRITPFTLGAVTEDSASVVISLVG